MIGIVNLAFQYDRTVSPLLCIDCWSVVKWQFSKFCLPFLSSLCQIMLLWRKELFTDMSCSLEGLVLTCSILSIRCNWQKCSKFTIIIIIFAALQFPKWLLIPLHRGSVPLLYTIGLIVGSNLAKFRKAGHNYLMACIHINQLNWLKILQCIYKCRFTYWHCTTKSYFHTCDAPGLTLQLS